MDEDPCEKGRNPFAKVGVSGQGQREETHQEGGNLQGTGGPRLGPTGRGVQVTDHWLSPPGTLGGKKIGHSANFFHPESRWWDEKEGAVRSCVPREAKAQV